MLRTVRCPFSGRELSPRALLLALTLVVAIVVLIMCFDAAAAIAVVAALLGFCAARWSGMSGATAAPGASHGDPDSHREEPRAYREEPRTYREEPRAYREEPRAYREEPHARHGSPHARYPGAIEADEYDTEGADGHQDLAEYDDPPEGNPYNTSRIAYQPAAAECVDDEANDDEMDADERNTYQGRSRNDATRVTAGTMNRRRAFDKYLREEVEEAEDRVWWGRHEE